MMCKACRYHVECSSPFQIYFPPIRRAGWERRSSEVVEPRAMCLPQITELGMERLKKEVLENVKSAQKAKRPSQIFYDDWKEYNAIIEKVTASHRGRPRGPPKYSTMTGRNIMLLLRRSPPVTVVFQSESSSRARTSWT